MNSISRTSMCASLLAVVMAFSSCGAKKTVGPNDSGGGQSSSQVDTGTPMDPAIGLVDPSTDTTVDTVLPTADSDQGELEYNPGDFRNVDSSEHAKRITGARTDDSLLYTTTGVDNVVDYFRNRNEHVGSAQRASNLALAASISKVEMQKMSDGSAVIRVRLNEGNRESNLVFNSELSSSISPAQLVGSNAPIQATTRCLDLDGGCDNVLLRLTSRANGLAVASVMLRQSIADLYFELMAEGEQSQNPEFLRVKRYLMNSVNNAPSVERVNVVMMNSFEVVNGRSGVQVQVLMYDGEAVVASGALLAPQVGTQVNIPYSLERLPVSDDSADLVSSSQQGHFNIVNSLSDVRLVNNNGLGQIRLQFKMRRLPGQRQDRFNLVIYRRIKPLVQAGDGLLN